MKTFSYQRAQHWHSLQLSLRKGWIALFLQSAGKQAELRRPTSVLMSIHWIINSLQDKHCRNCSLLFGPFWSLACSQILFGGTTASPGTSWWKDTVRAQHNGKVINIMKVWMGHSVTSSHYLRSLGSTILDQWETPFGKQHWLVICLFL